jgi:hypothetical protein
MELWILSSFIFLSSVSIFHLFNLLIFTYVRILFGNIWGNLSQPSLSVWTIIEEQAEIEGLEELPIQVILNRIACIFQM